MITIPSEFFVWQIKEKKKKSQKIELSRSDLRVILSAFFQNN